MKQIEQIDESHCPVFRFQGRQVMAEYLDSPIPGYSDNPLIEALPKILTAEESREALACRPAIAPEGRLMPKQLRLYMTQTVLDLVTPLPINQELEESIGRTIRNAYARRNPRKTGHLAGVSELVKTFGDIGLGSQPLCSGGSGFGIFGIPGGGKSTGIERVLQLYPQVICHTAYKGRQFNQVQLVWLKLDCPNDGSIRGLCQGFFAAVDAQLQTKYYAHYRADRRTADALLCDVARVAAIHSIGVLIIDEIQHLSAAKSGGDERMLNFFVQLANTIGVPVILVGTYKALPILGREFRQIRRVCGQGCLRWDRMKNDQLWEYFTMSMWPYQYLREETRWTKELAAALYDECQGIIDIAVKLFMMSQCEAIRMGAQPEALTPTLFHRVAQKHFDIASAILRALRDDDFAACGDCGDVLPPRDMGQWGLTPKASNSVIVPPLSPSARKSANSAGQSGEHASADLELTEVSSSPAPREANVRKNKASNTNLHAKSPGTMMGIVASGLEHNHAPYDSLKRAGLTALVGEYVQDKPIA